MTFDMSSLESDQITISWDWVKSEKKEKNFGGWKIFPGAP